MRIAFLSCFYPYRGGISQFSGCMMLELAKEHEVKAFNFSRQYPSLLFPGSTQYVMPGDFATKVDSDRVLDSVNPFTWKRTARRILEWKPDVVYICWWNTFFGPSMGRVAHFLKRRGVKVVGILHNVIPHEHRALDKPLTRHFLGGCTGFVTLGNEGSESLRRIGSFPSTELFHPVYSQFGEKLPREEAEKKLGIPAGGKNLLFFGLIRKYKGLDILIKAFGLLPADYHLLIAGEPYGGFEEYQTLIDSNPGAGRIHCFTGYVADEEVKTYFSAADLSVLPYRSATQSGVRAVSYNFGVPMVVTDTGSLRADIEGTGTGLVAPEPSPEVVAETIRRYFDTPGLAEKCRENIVKEMDRLSWKHFCSSLLEFTATI